MAGAGHFDARLGTEISSTRSWAGPVRDTSYEIQGSKHNKLNGYFKSVVWEGIGSQSSGAPSIGAQAVSLAE